MAVHPMRGCGAARLVRALQIETLPAFEPGTEIVPIDARAGIGLTAEQVILAREGFAEAFDIGRFEHARFFDQHTAQIDRGRGKLGPFFELPRIALDALLQGARGGVAPE